MSNIRVLIVEDKVIIAESIALLLTKHSFEVIGMVDSGEEALKIVEGNQPDLILMDVQLAGAMDGISTASMIRDRFNIPVIYLSDYADQSTIARAKITTPAAYLTKPFQDDDLVRALDIAFYNASKEPQKKSDSRRDLMLRVDQLYLKLAPSDILYLKADRSYCNIVTVQKTYMVSHNMSHIYEQLDHDLFIRVHRSYVVNGKRIDKIEGNTLHIGEHQVLMSQEYKETVSSLFRFIR